MARKSTLKQRFEIALVECGSDPRLADLLVRSLRRRGVAFDATGQDHCLCFPRTMAPRKIDGDWVCRLCALRLDSAREQRVAKELER